MKIDTLKTSFTSGEFAPALFGRVDIAQYANACELVENFLVRPYGPIIATPGTEFINDCKFQEPDGNDENCVLLLHADGTNLSKVIVDASPSNHEVKVVGKAFLSTEQKKFGTSSFFPATSDTSGTTTFSDFSSYGRTVSAFGASKVNYNGVFSLHGSNDPYLVLDGAGDYLQIPNSSDFNFGTEDFTIDFSLYMNPLKSSGAIVTYIKDTNNYWAVCLTNSNIAFKAVEAGSTIVEATWAFAGQWGGGAAKSMEVSRSSGTMRLFIGGILMSSNTLQATSIPVTESNFENNVLLIGRFDLAQTILDWQGFMDDVRISKGIARNITNYDSSAYRYTYADDQYTLLLLNMGDSGYLEIPDSDDFYFGGIDYTIDFWARWDELPIGTSDTQYIMAQFPEVSGGYLNQWSLNKETGNHKITATFSGSTNVVMVVTNTTLQINKWTHVAIVTEGTGGTLYIDGVTQGTYAYNNHGSIPNVTGRLQIGGYKLDFSRNFKGYIDEFRISKVARWTTDFTPPTVPYVDPDDPTFTRYYGKARLIPFVFSRDDAYVIEVGESYFRFYTDGAVVVSSGTTVLEITHTYTVDEIFDIQYAQINDVIYLTHQNHPPRRLTRISANNWTLTDFPFVGGPFTLDNVIYSGGTTSILSSATITPSALTGTACTLSATSNVFIASTTTLGHINSYWKVGDLVTNATTGLQEQGYVQITAITNPSTATATVMNSTLSGTGATTSWAQGSWSSVLGYPARIAFHQQRLAFARTDYQPQNVWASQSFSYENFAINSGLDDDALDIQLAAVEGNDIKWLSSGDSLIAGTYGGEFSIDSGDGSPLTPSNTNSKSQTSWGSEAILPKKIGNFVYYVQRFSKKVRELFFNFDIDSYKSLDKTILSPHITGDGIVDMAYQQNPDSILWCVTSDGTLATLTREVDQEVQGWARQVTDGDYESVAVIPSKTEGHDEVWVVVRRTLATGASRRYIERFKSQIVPDRQDKCFYVHSGLSYDAYNYSLSRVVDISLSATAGTSVLVTSTGLYFNSGDVGQRIRAINSSGSTIGELKITGYTSGTIIVGDIKKSFDATSYDYGTWGLSVNSLSGLDHLEGLDVSVLADGGLDKPAKTVSDGTITLGNDAFVITAGLPYTQKVKTLPQEAGAQRGTAQGKLQRISEVSVKVNRSFKGFKIGGNESYLSKVNFRDPSTLMGSPELLYTGVIPNIMFTDDYQYGSKVLIHNEEPLPLEILNITTTLDTQEK